MLKLHTIVYITKELTQICHIIKKCALLKLWALRDYPMMPQTASMLQFGKLSETQRTSRKRILQKKWHKTKLWS
jgi:hypothetical protein